MRLFIILQFSHAMFEDYSVKHDCSQVNQQLLLYLHSGAVLTAQQRIWKLPLNAKATDCLLISLFKKACED